MIADHRELLAAARAVETMVESESKATGDVARRIDALTELLESHVQTEEASPLYQDYPKDHPRFAERLERLKSEHRPLCEELHAVQESCASATSLPLDSPLSIRIRAIIAALRQHEADEAIVISDIHGAGSSALP